MVRVYYASGLGAIVKKIFLEIKETLVIFRIIFFQFFIEKTPERGFPCVTVNDAETNLRVSLKAG